MFQFVLVLGLIEALVLSGDALFVRKSSLERPLRPNYTMKQTSGLVKVIY